MPTAATVSPAGAVNGNASDKETGNGQAVATIPFTRASFRHHQPIKTITNVLTGSTQDTGVHEVTSYGYMRAIIIRVRGTGALMTTGSAAFAENGPFNVLQDVILSEPNGATIVHLNDGYQLMLANKFGGYMGFNDPRRLMTTDGEGNFEFILRIPVEISERDGLGSLPNQNAASSFQVRFKLAPNATVYSTVPDTTQATVQVDLSLEAWAQPLGATSHGGANQTVPPALNTTQYWSNQQYTVNTGLNRIRLNRVGNYLRNLLFVVETSGSRATGDGDFPVEDFKLWLDSTPVELNIAQQLWIERQYDRYGYYGTVDTAGARENGVYPYDFCHEFDGVVGHELRDAWLLSNTSSRLEVEGTFAADCVLRVITNDITVAGNVFL